MSREWICPGTNPDSPHAPEVMTGPDCTLCGMSREEALRTPQPTKPSKPSPAQSGSSLSSAPTQIDPYNPTTQIDPTPLRPSSQGSWPAWLMVIPGLVVVGVILSFLFGRSGCTGQNPVSPVSTCPVGQSMVNGRCEPVVTPPSIVNQISGLSAAGVGSQPSVSPSTGPAATWRVQRFFQYRSNQDADNGIKFFNRQQFIEALEALEKAVIGDPKDPEILIYKNNALARTKATATAPIFRIAVITPATQSDDVAMEILRGVAQAQDRFNKNGGLNGRYLELVLATDRNDPQEAQALAQTLVAQPDLLAVLGHNISSVTQTVLPIYEAAGIALISSTSTSTDLKSKTFFRSVPSDQATGVKLVDYLVSQSVKQVGLVHDQDNYSQSLLRVITAGLDAAQVRVVRKIDLTVPNFNASQVIEDLNNEPASDRPDVIVLIPGQKNKLVVNQLLKADAQRQQRFQFIGSDTLYNSDTLAIGADVVQGLILAVPWARDSTKAAQFAKRTQSQWKGDVGWRVATSYDAMQALIKALSDQADRTSVLTALQQLNLSADDTSGDPLAFTNGDRAGEAVLVEATNQSSCGQVGSTGMAFCLLSKQRSRSSSPSGSPQP